MFDGHLNDGRLGARLECVSQLTLATILTVFVESHENSSTALRARTFTTKAFDFAIRVDFVVLENGHLDLLTLVLDLLGGVVGLLLALLCTTTETEN
jgi:hypothetical protein